MKREYYTIVYSDDEILEEDGLSRVIHEEGQAVAPLGDMPVEGKLVFDSKKDAVGYCEGIAVRVHERIES